MKIIYFTATGNSLYIAKTLTNDIHSIPQLIKNNEYTFTSEKIGIVFPLYSNSVPPYIEQFLLKATFNTKYLFAIITYGIYDAAVAEHIISIANNCNYKFSYINTIKMVDNWLPGFKMKNQIKSETNKKIEEKLLVIKNEIDNDFEYIIKSSKLDKIITNYQVKNKDKENPKDSLHGNTIGKGIKNFLCIEDGCIKCKTCIKVCPVNNIDLIDNEIKLKNYCLTCFSCTQNCPINVMRIKSERDKTRFRNKNVTLNEIISSNKQID